MHPAMDSTTHFGNRALSSSARGHIAQSVVDLAAGSLSKPAQIRMHKLCHVLPSVLPRSIRAVGSSAVPSWSTCLKKNVKVLPCPQNYCFLLVHIRHRRVMSVGLPMLTNLVCARMFVTVTRSQHRVQRLSCRLHQ